MCKTSSASPHGHRLDFGGQQVGNAGFLFLPDVLGARHDIRGRASRGMKYWFEEMEPRLNMALGMNPSGNHLVQRFLHGLGWTRVGQLPIPQYYGGTHSDLVIWYYTREQYERDKGAA
jgi:hypothetical protein